MMAVADSAASRSETVASPGKILRETRLQLGLEPENAAQMLHLSPQQIEALEGDDFANLPEPIYVRGYLRSYCQLLAIDAEPVLEAYAAVTRQRPVTNFSGLATEKQVTSTDHLMKLASFLVAVIVIGLAIVWWLGLEEDAPAVKTVTPTEPQAVPADRAGLPEGLIASPAESLLQEELSGAAPVEETGTVKLPAVVVEKMTPVGAETERTVEETNGVTRAASEARSEGAQAPVIPPSTAMPAAEEETGAATRSRLALHFKEMSWADIRDARDNKLLYETVAAGRVVRLEGVAPFKIFLGNANGVTLVFDGTEYDLSPHKRGLTARFVLGGEPTAKTDE